MVSRKLLLLLASHLAFGFGGFAAGIYMLPILIAPASPPEAELKSMVSQTSYIAEFKRELEDSDIFHWGEGQVSIGPDFIFLMGRLAPGPDYKLYLSPVFVETEADFNRQKNTMALVGDVKTFDNFAVAVPSNIDPMKFTSVIVWCESFGEFITAAKYR